MPLCCNDANVNHCSKNNFFTLRLHAVMIFGNICCCHEYCFNLVSFNFERYC